MDKFSSIDRVVGNVSEEEKTAIHQEMGERFSDQIFSDLKEMEREKTREELEIIGFANEATNEIRRKYNLPDFDVSRDNIHVVEGEKWPKDYGAPATYKTDIQAVAMREVQSRLVFLVTVFHEMIHFKSYNAIQVPETENIEFDEYRTGLIVRTRDGEKRYFTNLNEAVTEEVTKKYVVKIFTEPMFVNEILQTREVIEGDRFARNSSGDLLFDDDTYYAEAKFEKGKEDIMSEGFIYGKQRVILNILIDKLFERNPDKFKDKEEVFEVFEKGMITGNILEVGRLIEKTFGNGTFRKIGELDSDIEAQIKFVNSL